MILRSTFRLLAMLFLSNGLLGFAACNSEDDDNADAPRPQGQAPQPDYVTPTPADASGALIAYKTITTESSFIGDIDFEFGGGVTIFFSNNDPESFIEAGTVELEETALTKQENNAYTFTPTATDSSGITFSGDEANWTVSGAGDVPAFDASYSGFPSLGDIQNLDANPEVSRSRAFDLSVASVRDADSVIFAAYSTDGVLLETLPGVTKDHTFTTAEMGELANGSGLVQVTAYQTRPTVVDGKTFYLINQSVRTRSVKFVD